jgi:hypothetical protein
VGADCERSVPNANERNRHLIASIMGHTEVYFLPSERRWRLMKVAILLFCFALAFGQDTSTAPETKPQTPASSADQKQQPTETSPNNNVGKYATGMSQGAFLRDLLNVIRRPTAGEARAMTPTVTGTEKQAVKWRIRGLGCFNSSCGVMLGNLYLAPNVPPIPNEVTLTAVSEADPTAKVSVIVHILEPASKIAPKP